MNIKTIEMLKLQEWKEFQIKHFEKMLNTLDLGKEDRKQLMQICIDDKELICDLKAEQLQQRLATA